MGRHRATANKNVALRLHRCHSTVDHRAASCSNSDQARSAHLPRLEQGDARSAAGGQEVDRTLPRARRVVESEAEVRTCRRIALSRTHAERMGRAGGHCGLDGLLHGSLWDGSLSQLRISRWQIPTLWWISERAQLVVGVDDTVVKERVVVVHDAAVEG